MTAWLEVVTPPTQCNGDVVVSARRSSQHAPHQPGSGPVRGASGRWSVALGLADQRQRAANVASRDLALRLALFAVSLPRKVREGDHAEQHMLVIDNGKASDVRLPHGPLRCFDRVTWRTCEQVFGHRVGD